ncbi:hypothetical protein [Neoaquamicrobium sediminum]|uniref:hypothetical protein n=1 Tax=Neoaquamicrobium sediminum TaxID=1849104 RepID=UPI001563BB17|nr:hypothetical protein [Mesorhizobium sediminum]NRC54147.1 hypothetical protein [Mesorhizobium sediminum]
MFDWLRESVIYSTPWWVWAAPAIGAGAAMLVTVSRVVGLRNALLAGVAYAVVVLTAMSHLRGRQAGWEDRARKDARDAEKLVQRIKNARRNNAARPAGRLRDDDGYKRR